MNRSIPDMSGRGDRRGPAMRGTLAIFLTVALAAGSALGQDATPVAQNTSAAPAPFRTKYARFEPAPFAALPGWQDDRIAQAWTAFRQTCLVLSKKPAWSAPCARAAGLSGTNDAALRLFFEQEFDLFQIYNADNTPAGVITGYYEPQLNGSRRYSASTPYPVYAVPDDLLLLDARLLPTSPGAEKMVRVDGHAVLPADATKTAAKTYRLDLTGIEPDIRTRKYRLRIDGDRVVAYLTRQEIESAPMTRARVIAWVDNRAALYSMQLQGSGKIRLANGDFVRVGYAEQNGHAFQPSVLASAQYVNGKASAQRIVTRGLGGGIESDDDPAARSKAELMAAFIASMQQSPAQSRSAGEGPAPAFGQRPQMVRDPGKGSDVERMIALLMQGPKGKTDGAPASVPAAPAVLASAPAPSPTPSTGGPDAFSGAQPATAVAYTGPAREDPRTTPPLAVVAETIPTVAAPQIVQAAPVTPTTRQGDPAPVQTSVSIPALPENSPVAAVKAATVPAPRTPARQDIRARPALTEPKTATVHPEASGLVNGDPSYVFFREIANSVDGPIGAMGIPLTAGRSLAVDPRTTPLGFPVFISTRETAGKQGLNRLMLAQDTGGAIRGAVRADYFWGFGERAFVQASQMKEDGKMWLLLPKGQKRPAQTDSPRLRGIGGAAPALSECVVADPENCAE